MPLVYKTLSEVSAELGMLEAEIRALADLRKIRSVLKRGKMTFAPDEVAKIKHLRRTLPESAIRSAPAATATTAGPAQPTPAPASARKPHKPKKYEP